MTLPYAVGALEYGRELLAEVIRDGITAATKSEVYSVADNLWKVAIGSPSGGNIPGVAPYSRETIAAQLRNARKQYANWYEADFWAPDDWGLLVTEPGASWFSCQTGRPENTEKLQSRYRPPMSSA